MSGTIISTMATQPGDPVAWLAPLIMVIGVLSIGVLLTLSIRNKVARREADRPDPRELIERIRAERKPTNDVNAATAEYLDMTQRLASQLEFKAQRLEQLMHQADRRIETLTRLAAGDGSAEPDASSDDRSTDPLAREIYDLADSGRDAVDIARELNENVGKVELILSLRGGPA